MGNVSTILRLTPSTGGVLDGAAYWTSFGVAAQSLYPCGSGITVDAYCGAYSGYSIGGNCDQIASGANYSGGEGGRGFRHWVGDAVNSHGGGIGLDFPAQYQEFWMRWYMRYELGFAWSTLLYDKWLYIYTHSDINTGTQLIPEFTSGSILLAAQGTGNSNKCTTNGYGWNDIMGGSTGDGLFHCYEFHVKMDTDQTDGEGRIWVDGTLRAEYTDMDWSNGHTGSKLGWLWMMIGQNQSQASNGGAAYTDYDDIVIYDTTPPNTDAGGNPMIGTL